MNEVELSEAKFDLRFSLLLDLFETDSEQQRHLCHSVLVAVRRAADLERHDRCSRHSTTLMQSIRQQCCSLLDHVLGYAALAYDVNRPSAAEGKGTVRREGELAPSPLSDSLYRRLLRTLAHTLLVTCRV